MTNDFVFSELLLYIVPVVIIFVVQKYLKSYLKFFDKYPLNLAILLLPLWLTLIHLFSKLIFGFSLIPFILFITAFALGLQLYDYIRRIDMFTFQEYYMPASQLISKMFSAFLVGLVILRVYTYFQWENPPLIFHSPPLLTKVDNKLFRVVTRKSFGSFFV